MIKRTTLLAWMLLVGLLSGICAATVHADPFTPAEIKYLKDVRPNLDGPWASWSDEKLVGEGWFACHDHAIGLNLDQAGISPVVGTYALLDLCPNGCAQGCLHRG